MLARLALLCLAAVAVADIAKDQVTSLPGRFDGDGTIAPAVNFLIFQ